jgi:hypothetical protein
MAEDCLLELRLGKNGFRAPIQLDPAPVQQHDSVRAPSYNRKIVFYQYYGDPNAAHPRQVRSNALGVEVDYELMPNPAGRGHARPASAIRFRYRRTVPLPTEQILAI